MPYATVDRFFTTYPKFSTVHSGTMNSFLVKASAVIDAHVARVLTVPVTPAPELLTGLCEDLAYIQYLRRNSMEASRDSTIDKMYADCMGLLDDISAGRITIVGSGGVALSSADLPWSSVRDYVPTFGVFDIEDAKVDNARLADDYAERGYDVASLG